MKAQRQKQEDLAEQLDMFGDEDQPTEIENEFGKKIKIKPKKTKMCKKFMEKGYCQDLRNKLNQDREDRYSGCAHSKTGDDDDREDGEDSKRYKGCKYAHNPMELTIEIKKAEEDAQQDDKQISPRTNAINRADKKLRGKIKPPSAFVPAGI